MKFTHIIVYTFVVTLETCIAFPFIVSSVATLPKRVIKYRSTAAASPLPTVRQFKRTEPVLLDNASNNLKYDNVMFSDDQYIEQQELKSSQSSDGSDLYPIYVHPPPNFQPIVYPTSRADGVSPTAKVVGNKQLTINLPHRTFPYTLPHGFSSFIFGGLSGLQRGSFWEQLSTDLALHNPVKANHQPNRVVVYVQKTLPVSGSHAIPNSWMQIPTLEAHSVVDEQLSDNKVIKTKLPVGLTSFFLGGMRGVSGRHWQMPSTLVEQVEFMPDERGKPLSSAEKKKIEYKPAVQFDDESELYNVIKHD